MRGKLQRKLNNKSGFTLAETLVALAISIILLAITMVGILQYYKNMKLTEMDMTAKEIFIAAQNHLTAADASGELKRYREKALDDSKTEVKKEALGTLIIEEPKDVPEGIVWPSPNEDYYYIEYNIPSGTTGNLEGSILQYMLPFGAIDETVRADGKYIIEYNVKTATIYGVFYAADDVNYSYNDIIVLNKDGGRADSADGRHTRRDYDAGIIGYYGGAMAGDLLSGETDELTLEIHNKDTLEVVIRDFNYFKKATDGTTPLYTHIVFTVEGKDSGNKEEFTLDLADGTDPTKDDPSSQKWWTVKKEKTAGNKPVEYLEYTITLDDVTRPGGHFADICPTLMPGEDIIVKAVSSSNSAAATVREATDMTNSLFEAVRLNANTTNPGTDSTEATASIGYLRHLENLDSDVLNLPKKFDVVKVDGKEVYKPAYVIKNAEQVYDIDYEDYFGADKDARKSVYKFGLSETDENAAPLAKESYYGIRNDLLTAYAGCNKKISNVRAVNTTEDIKLSDDNVITCNAGLFYYVNSNLTVKDLTLIDFTVEADRNAAMLIADIGQGHVVTLDNILINGGTVSSNKGRGNAGALIGYTGSQILVSNCAAVVKSVGNGGRLNKDYAGDAGGLIGEINNSIHTNVEISIIKNCYTGGQTVNGKYSKKYTDFNVFGRESSGGLIGKIKWSNGLQISNCYSTCSVYIGSTKNMNDKGAAGGLVGYDKSRVVFTDCYATGLVDGDANQYKGAFLGRSAGSDEYVVIDEKNTCYYLDGINDNDLQVVGFGQKGQSIEKKTYAEMKRTKSDTETYVKDTTLEKKEYPFTMVNRVGAKKSNTIGVHYGDWQVPREIEEPTALMFAYREKKQNKWYVVKAEKLDDLLSYTVILDTLTTEKDIKIEDEECEYGFLWEGNGNGINGEFNKNELQNFLDEKNKTSSAIKIKNKEYTFYPVKNTEVHGIRSTPASKDGISFSFNSDFAAAIGAAHQLGTRALPYQVRTNLQLRNISKLSSYDEAYFNQTVDIILSDDEFKAFGGKVFKGCYDAYSEDRIGYSIKNFSQKIEKNETPGLITKIGASATVSYVNLYGKIEIKTGNLSYIGSISGELQGKLENCNSYVEIEMEAEDKDKFSGDIGGLVGRANTSASISECHYESEDEELELELKNLDEVNVGGLVGYNSGTIMKSSSNLEIEFSHDEEKDEDIDIKNLAVGGLIGTHNLLGHISESWTKVSYKGDCTGNEIIGGFVGKIGSGASITNSYAVLETYEFRVADETKICAFAGMNEAIAGVAGSVTCSHAIMFGKDGKRMYSKYPFIGGASLFDNAGCYLHKEPGESKEKGVTYINNIQTLGNVPDLSASLWESKNKNYVTLINNPEINSVSMNMKQILEKLHVTK